MDGLNKFKILTIVFLCMFVFVIAAIYTNTKEVTENKTNANQKIKVEQNKNDMNEEENEISQDNSSLQDLSIKVDVLTKRLDELQNGNSSNKLNCQVQGIMDGDRIEQLTQEAAIQEAKENNRELVLTCRY